MSTVCRKWPTKSLIQDFPGYVTRDFLLAPVYPIEKVAPQVGFLYQRLDPKLKSVTENAKFLPKLGIEPRTPGPSRNPSTLSTKVMLHLKRDDSAAKDLFGTLYIY